MVVKSDIALLIDAGNVAVVVGCMTHISAAAVTRNILHNIGICDVELIRGLNADRRRLDLGRHLVHRCHREIVDLTLRRTGRNTRGQKSHDDQQKKERGRP